MPKQKSTRKFKTEVREILDLIIHSLYSHREIFLRELISNASDAIDRLKYLSQTDPALTDGGEYKIKLTPDKKARTLAITDNGLGMTWDEVVENIGTIAHSGTSEFMEALKEAKKSGAPELIGQFGVGFYSAFMVADKITLTTRSATSETGVKWESDGNGDYTIEEVEKPSRGTTILLHLKPLEEGDDDYSDEWTLRKIVKRHSDFVAYPVTMDATRSVPVRDAEGEVVEGQYEEKTEEDVLNSMKAIWARPKAEITDEEYAQFYKHISHDWSEPLSRLHLKLEGTTEFDALLYIPSTRPMDLFRADRKHGVKLYSKRVFIMEDCKDLVPDYLRFLKGVVDSADLSLNVSREILQENRVVKAIRKTVVKKVLDHLSELPAEEYEKFYGEFGIVLKEGIHTDQDNREKLAKLLRYPTTTSEGKLISLDEYVAGMGEKQQHIYYITGETLTSLIDNPHLEKLKAAGFSVLLMADPVDEFVTGALTEYEGKSLKSAELGDLGLDAPEEAKKANEEFGPLLEKVKALLGDRVVDVKVSTRLTDSASCLSGEEGEMSALMMKILKAGGHKLGDERRVLEINTGHPLALGLKAAFDRNPDEPSLLEQAELLLELAEVAEGAKLKNPAGFSKRVAALAAKAFQG